MRYIREGVLGRGEVYRGGEKYKGGVIRIGKGEVYKREKRYMASI